jgi:SAM-dependent methyltransferase
MTTSTETAERNFLPRHDGILVPTNPVTHRDDEYDPAGFASLRDMQASHFWYRGRHRFLLHAARKLVRTHGSSSGRPLRAIDVGGGCGGWIAYLSKHAPDLFDELALCDSSLHALQMAGDVVGPDVARYQADLLNLPWSGDWDAVFLLDVLEHIPDDVDALGTVARAVRPGGLLFVTTPALRFFWSYNDDLAHHVRRYSRADVARLAKQCDLELRYSRYFMFFLSPLLYLSRHRGPNVATMTDAERRDLMRRTHAVPARPVNAALTSIFSLETPLGDWLPFPWGTSILAAFRQPAE